MKKPAKQTPNRPSLLACLLVPLLFLPAACNDSAYAPYQPAQINIQDLIPQATETLRQGLSNPNPAIRTNAIEAVANTAQTDLMPRVQYLLTDDFVPVRFSAALAVGDTKYISAERTLKQLLKDSDENVKLAANYALFKLGYDAKFKLIAQAARSTDPTVRANAVLVLGKTGDQRALETLYWAKDDPDSDSRVIFEAAEAIAKLGDQRIFSKLWTLLISKYIENKIAGIRAMGALGTAEAKNALITMLADPVIEVRLIAAEQLGMLGYDTGQPEVLDVFTTNLTVKLEKPEIERAKILAALAIGQIGTEKLTPYLPTLLADNSPDVRIAAAKAVLQLAAKTK